MTARSINQTKLPLTQQMNSNSSSITLQNDTQDGSDSANVPHVPGNPGSPFVSPRMIAFERLTRTLPLNDLGMPKFFYRPDYIPGNLDELSSQERNKVIDASVMPITYNEGYPALPDGLPIWSQLEFESGEEYTLFDQYLNQMNPHGFRQYATLVDEKGGEPTFQFVKESFVYNYWVLRAKAYDLFLAAVHRRHRERRLMLIENQHFLQADNLLRGLEEEFKNRKTDDDPTGFGEVPAKDLVNMFKTLAGIQRDALSGGSSLPAGRRTHDSSPPPNSSLEVVLRNIAQKAGADVSQAEVKRSVDILKDDPESAGILQELIIRMGGAEQAEIHQRQLAAEPEIESQDIGRGED